MGAEPDTDTEAKRLPPWVVCPAGDRGVRAIGFTCSMPPPDRRPGVERVYKHKLRVARQGLGRDLLRIRTDAAATHGQVAALAGIDRSHYSRIEAGTANPSLETLTAIATALGADVSVRIYPGTGPRLTDRHQARMIEAILRSLGADWRPHVEVPVSRPVRGVIDAVLERPAERPAERLLVATEAYSELRRLEQQIRWSADKAASLGSSDLVGPGPAFAVSRLLVLRSTAATRELARQFESTMRAAYPARTSMSSTLRRRSVAHRARLDPHRGRPHGAARGAATGRASGSVRWSRRGGWHSPLASRMGSGWLVRVGIGAYQAPMCRQQAPDTLDGGIGRSVGTATPRAAPDRPRTRPRSDRGRAP
jgi:transcriptional regulator with XRE-family HTH domain